MAIKISQHSTNNGARFTITGLTFEQLFRIKQGMYREAEQMKNISEDKALPPFMQGEFKRFSQDATDVFDAISNVI